MPRVINSVNSFDYRVQAFFAERLAVVAQPHIWRVNNSQTIVAADVEIHFALTKISVDNTLGGVVFKYAAIGPFETNQ